MEQFGKIRLFNCDCMELMKTTPDKYYDLAIADPPYRDAKDNQPTMDMRRNGDIEEFGDKPTQEYFDELFRISKNQIIWGANNFELPPYKGFIIWKKTMIGENFTMSMAELAYTSEGLGTISKVFECSPHRNKDNKWHPTSKPVNLYKWLLKNYAKPEYKIIDTHAGSLSSGIACNDFGCELDACEIVPKFYELSKQRLIEHQKQLTLF